MRESSPIASPADRTQPGGLNAQSLDLFRKEIISEVGSLREAVERFAKLLEERDLRVAHEIRVGSDERVKLAQTLAAKSTENLRSELNAVRAELAASRRAAEGNANYLERVLASRSWRITAPLRQASRLTQHARNGVWAWLTFRRGSRPHRIATRLGLVRHVVPEVKLIAQPSVVAPTVPPQIVASNRSVQPEHPPGSTVFLFVDHTIDCNVNTGIQRTVRGLASGLTRRGQPVRFVKWDASSLSCVLINADERRHLAQWNGPPITEDDEKIYLPGEGACAVPYPALSDWIFVPEATWISNQNRPVTFDLIRWARESGARIGFVFYDAIPLRRPEHAASVESCKTYMRGLAHADAIWSISNWSGADLMAFWSAERIVSCPPVYSIALPGAFTPVRPRASGTPEDLILCVGTIEQRKNQVALVRAFRSFKARNPQSTWQLVLAGNLHPAVAPEIDAATRAEKAIRYLGPVSEDELKSLYARCAFTVFPSVEEGFGLPILESLWYGKPSICADFGAMAEVAAAGGCLTCDTRSDAALEQAIERLISDGPLRSRLTKQAGQLALSDWSDYAGGVLNTVWPVGQIYLLAQATADWDRNTGIQRVVRQLARALLELGLDVIPVKLAADGRSLEQMSAAEIEKLSAFNGPAANRWRGWVPPAKARPDSWFVMAELPLHLAPDVHDALIANLHKAKVKLAAVFYDAIPWKMTSVYPEQYGQTHARYMKALSAYDIVAPISKHSETDLIQFLQLSKNAYPARVNAVLLPGEFSESRRVTEPMSPSTEGPFEILSIGTIEPRKNHEALLEAFVAASAKSTRAMQLVLVGSSVSVDPSVPVRVRAFVDRHANIRWEEHADDARVKELYQSCDFTVYPSVEEGFGLPIVESLWYGKPVICGNFGAMAEVLPGGGCVAVDVRDKAAITDAILALTAQPARLKELSRQAVTRHFKTWKEYGSEFAEALQPSNYPTLSVPEDLEERQQSLGHAVSGKALSDTESTTAYYLVESTADYDQNTGIQRVVRQLARHLMRRGVGLIPVRWNATSYSLEKVSQAGIQNLARFNGPKPDGWTPWREPEQMRGRWFIMPEVHQHWRPGDHVRLIENMKSNEIRTASIFHDAIPLKMSKLYPDWLVKAHFRYMIELAFYDLILPNSFYSGRDLAQFLDKQGVGSERQARLIHPVALAGEFPESPRTLTPHAVVSSKPLHMLSIGTVEPRKNHATLVKAFLLAAKRCKRPLELTIIGNRNAVDPGLAELIRSQIEGHRNIRWLEKVDDVEIVKWKAWSDLTVYPSMEEGFGLPIVESLWYGKPVICANFGAMLEVAEGGGCLTVDVRDPDAFADAICLLASNTELLAKLGREAVQRPLKSWADYADEIRRLMANVDVAFERPA